jgi:hypothetical protein
MDDKPCPYVTGSVTRYCTLTPLTLTDEERAAIAWAVHWITSSTPNSFCPPALRSLLDRTDRT